MDFDSSAHNEPPTPTAPSVGARIGPYELKRVLGEGGMGTVYLAEQSEPLPRRVALKVIKLGMDSKQVLVRFELERQALARMNHENIARVYDAGVTERGQPYFVMEYVDGTPITDFCDVAKLNNKQRLELFERVCEGVQHAHHKGVIHRDLKPTNVLVAQLDGDPTPKIIDFGLARATAPGDLHASLITEHGQVIGTPEYMSPEQAELSEPEIDTRTDVYSLGVLLYELLSGRLPFSREELLSGGILEGLRRIRDSEPQRPSTRLLSDIGHAQIAARIRHTSAPALERELRGDLDWIVMQALEKDRDRRYQTAAAFAEDIERHLHLEPVKARPPSTAYRIAKFSRRHRGTLVAATAVLAALVLGLVMFALENARAQTNARRANTARQAAEERLQLAMEAVESYFTGVAQDTLLQEPELEALRNRLLESPLEFYARLRESLQASGAAADRTRLYVALQNLGRITALVGSQSGAAAAFREALAVQEELRALEPTDDRHAIAMADAQLALAYCLEATGQLDEADAAFAAAVLAVDGLPPSVSVTVLRANALEGRANLQILRGSHELAEISLTEARDLRLAAASQQPSLERDLAATQRNLALLYSRVRPIEDAEAAAREALETSARTLERQPNGTGARSDHANSQMSLGMIIGRAGRLDESIQHYGDAIATLEDLLALEPGVTSRQKDLAIACQDYGLALMRANRPNDALKAYQRAIELYGPLVSRYPEHERYRRSYCLARLNLGELYGRMRRYEEALALFEPAAEDLTLLHESHAEVTEYGRYLATVQNSRATALQALGQMDAARDAFERASEILADLVADHPEDTELLGRRGGTEYNVGQLAERARDYEQALARYETSLGLLEHALELDPQESLARRLLPYPARGRAEVLSRLERFEESLRAWERVQQIAPDDATRTQAHLMHAVTLARAGRPEEAVAAADGLFASVPVFEPDHFVQLAMLFAQASATFADAPSQDQSAARALDFLGRAREGGAFENPYRVDEVRVSSFFDPLRERVDFAEFIASLPGAQR